MEISKMRLRVLLALVFLLSTAYADQVISNSKDWKFMLLVGEYAKIKGDRFLFLHSEKDVDLLAKMLYRTSPVYVYEDKNAFFKNYATYLRNFYQLEAYTMSYSDFDDLQRDLFKKLNPSFAIVVSPLEPENAIISLSLALRKGGIVAFATEKLPEYITADNIYVVGRIDEEVLKGLQARGIQIRKIDEGSPLKNAFVLADEFGKINAVLATTGDFLEPSLFDAKYPILLVGRTSYSREFMDFLKEKKIKTVYLIGTELLAVGRMIRDDSNKTISVVIKYGMGFTNLPGMEGQVYALAVLPVNIPLPKLRVGNVIYDTANRRLLVVIENSGRGQAYVKAAIQIVSDGETLKSIIDRDVTYVEPLKNTTLSYNVDLDMYLDKNLTALLNIKYGRYRNYLNDYIADKGEIPPVKRKIIVREFEKISKLEVSEDVVYSQKCFRIEISNPNAFDVFASGYISYKEREIPAEKEIKIEGNAKNKLVFCTSEDLAVEDGDNARVVIRYGTEKDLLANVIAKDVKIKISRLEMRLLTIAALGGVGAGVLILAGKRKRREKRKIKYARVKTKRLKRIKRK